MKQIPISKFKATCLAVCDDVHKPGVPVRVKRYGEPVADVTPPQRREERAGQIGVLGGTISIPEGIVEMAAAPEGGW